MSGLPDKVPGHWETENGAAVARMEVKRKREQLAYGNRSDYDLANAIFMVDRGSLDMLPMQQAAKERIRWLSVQLAVAQAQIADLESYKIVYSKAVDAMSKHMQCGGRFAHLLQLGDSITIKGPDVLVAEIDRVQANNATLIAAAEAVEKLVAPLVDAGRSRADFTLAVQNLRNAIANGKRAK